MLSIGDEDLLRERKGLLPSLPHALVLLRRDGDAACKDGCSERGSSDVEGLVPITFSTALRLRIRANGGVLDLTDDPPP